MKCPSCSSLENKVVDSRLTRDADAIRRRRECLSCGARFTTYEYVERTQVLVIKKDGRREPFRREKIEEGVLKACEKRPVSKQEVDALLDRVEAKVLAMGQSEVESRQIGELVIEELEQLDKIAYVRFASVYRQFRSVDDFVDEMKRIAGRSGAKDKTKEEK
jgi:transcriptional repressor NrdR